MGKKVWEFTALTEEELDTSVELLGARSRATKKIPLGLILNRIAAAVSAASEVATRVNTIITGASSEKDAEVVDIRTGIEETVYDCAGDAVRSALQKAKDAADAASAADSKASEAKTLAENAQSQAFTYQEPTAYGNWKRTYGGYWKHGNEVHVTLTFQKTSGTISTGISTPSSGQTGSSYKEKAFTGFPPPLEPTTINGTHIISTSSVDLAMCSLTTDGTLYIGVPGATSANSSYSNYIHFSYLSADE